MSRWKDCIFDLYGTLVDIRTDERSPQLWRAMARWYRERGTDYQPGELRARYFSLVRQQERSMRAADGFPGAQPEIRIERVFRQLFRDRGVRPDPALIRRTGEYFRRCSLRRLRLSDGAEELLAALRANGQRVWLLSNAQRVFTAYELRSLGLEPCFDGVYLSSDWSVKKPDPRFFRLLLRRQDIRPETAVMIGNDGACDIAGARAAGLATVYVRSAISPREPLPDADYALDPIDLARVWQILTQ